jgi:hypothetical protein
MSYDGDVAAKIRSGRPDAYFDYIERTYGDAFRAGTPDTIETFVLLYRQISALGNAGATNRFGQRFVPKLPLDARRKITNEELHKPQKPSDRPS